MTHLAFGIIQIWKCLFLCMCAFLSVNTSLTSLRLNATKKEKHCGGKNGFRRHLLFFLSVHLPPLWASLSHPGTCRFYMKSIDNASPRSCLNFWWRAGGRGWRRIKQVSSHLQDVLIWGDAGHGVINLSHRSVLLHRNDLDRDSNAPAGQNRCVQDLCVLWERDICHFI